MSKFTLYIARVMSVLLFLGLVLMSVTTSVFEIGFYTKVQEENHVSQNMNISEEDVYGATEVALLFTKGFTDDLTYEVEKDASNNAIQPYDVYSEQDKVHMIDVANLYKSAYMVMVATFIIILIMAVILLVKRKEVNVFSLTETYNKVSLYSLVFVAVLAIFAAVNFNTFWTYFHKVFFTNDLWLMNPAKDALVNLFPEALFQALVFKIIKRFILLFATSNIVAYLYRAYSLRGVKK